MGDGQGPAVPEDFEGSAFRLLPWRPGMPRPGAGGGEAPGDGDGGAPARPRPPGPVWDLG